MIDEVNYGSLITTTKCYKCIHFPLCIEQKGGINLGLSSENDCTYFQPKLPNDVVVLTQEEWATVHEQFAQAMYQKEVNTRKETVVKIFDALYQWLDLENTEKCGFATIQKFDFLNKFRELYQQFGIEIKE